MLVKPKIPLLPLVGGAVVVAVGVALLMNAWTSGGPARSPAATGRDGHDHVHLLAALYDINDPAQVLVVPASEAPRVTMHLEQTPDGAMQARLELANFAVAGADAGTANVPGRGHAHLYVDGEYVRDFAGVTEALPPLRPGNHEITVGLNSIDHRAFAADGRIVGDRIVLRVPDVSRRAPLAVPRVFAIDLKGGRAAGENTLRVRQNETIRLQWTSDVPITVHLEGYDIEALVAPQSPASMLFVADLPGRFPVEEHGAAGAHGRGALYYLEVYP